MSEKTQIRKLEKDLLTEVNFLVIEDMDNIRKQLVNDLRQIGVTSKIFEAANLQAAVKICQTEEFAFVISDWNLPDGTGHDFLKKFRAIEKFKKVPFVMCTTNSEINFFLEAVKSGANDYIVKPWKVEELKKKLLINWEMVNKK